MSLDIMLEHRSLSRDRALPGVGSQGRVGRRGSRTPLHTGAAAQGPRGLMGRLPGSCGPGRLFCSSRAEGAEIASWHPRNVNCFTKMLEFAGDGGLIISTLPGADRHETKSPRASVLSHRVVSHAKLSPGQKGHRLLIHRLAAREPFCRSLLFQQGLKGVRKVESSFIE